MLVPIEQLEPLGRGAVGKLYTHVRLKPLYTHVTHVYIVNSSRDDKLSERVKKSRKKWDPAGD